MLCTHCYSCFINSAFHDVITCLPCRCETKIVKPAITIFRLIFTSNSLFQSDPPPQTVPAVTSSSTASFKSDSDDGMRSLTLYESNNVIPTVSLSVTLTWQDDNHSISEPHNAKNKSRKKAQIDLSRITTDNFFKILLRPFCLCVWYEWSDQRYFFSRIFYPMGIGKSTSLAEFVTRLRNMLNAIPCRTLRELLVYSACKAYPKHVKFPLKLE